MKFTIVGKRVNAYYKVDCLMLRDKEKYFLKNALTLMVLAQHLHCTHKCYMPNLVEIDSVVPEKKLKMINSLRPINDERRRRKHRWKYVT